MNGKLWRVKKSEASGVTRSSEIEGEFNAWPKVGDRFCIVADKKFDGSPGNRLWITSVVTLAGTFESDDRWYFETETGSSYELDKLGD